MAEGGGEQLCTRFYCNRCRERACQMLAPCHMELGMVLDSRHSHLFLLGLHLAFTGGGRLRYCLLLPKRQVAPGSESSWIVHSR
jgi:hypothetical protein